MDVNNNDENIAKEKQSEANDFDTVKSYFDNIPIEIKWNEAGITGVQSGPWSIPTNGQFNLIAQGDGPTNRVGRRIRILAIRINGCTYANAGGDFITNYIVQDTNCNGAAATIVGGFLNSTPSNGGVALPNAYFSDRFKILRKYSFAVSAGAPKIFSDMFMLDKPIDVFYKDGGGTITSVGTNNIFFVCGGFNNGAVLFINWRIYFVDI